MSEDKPTLNRPKKGIIDGWNSPF